MLMKVGVGGFVIDAKYVKKDEELRKHVRDHDQ
jgi:hypothetical protein